MLEPQFQELLALDDPLAPFRKKYWEKFRDLGSLSLKMEAFQNVPLQNLVLPKAANELRIETTPKSKHLFKAVFIDGFFSIDHSNLPDDMVCLPLDEAIRPYGVFLQNRMVRSVKEETDPFSALNGAFLGRGAFLYAPPKKKIAEPIHIEHYFTGTDMASPRIIVNLGKQASLRIEESWHTDGEEANFANAHIDIVLDEGSELVLKTVQKKAPKAHLFQAIRASLKEESSFSAHLYSEGSAMSRHSVKIQLLEKNASALLEGVFPLGEQRQSHVHTLVEHLGPNAKSRQHFKMLLKDKATATCVGKIYVHPIAQKTESYQLMNTLLLSDQALSFAKPNLEIFADDVKASHGATVSQLDEESLFYLRTRGISKEEAKECLTNSFLKELSRCLPKDGE